MKPNITVITTTSPSVSFISCTCHLSPLYQEGETTGDKANNLSLPDEGELPDVEASGASSGDGVLVNPAMQGKELRGEFICVELPPHRMANKKTAFVRFVA